jgi:hypothetical protein
VAQRLTSLRQRTFDANTQPPKCLSAQELHQRCQFLLIEIKSNAPPAEIPKLDQLFVQAVGADLRKKLLSFLHPLPAASNNANLQRFSEMTQNAIKAEQELQTITDVADQAAHRSSKPCAGRQATQPRPGPHTFFNGRNEQDHQEEEHPEQHRMNTANTQCNIPNCDTCSHSSGPIVVPTCFLTKHAPGTLGEQQDLMARAIIAMGMAAKTLAEDAPFAGASVAEEALKNSSGMRVPIKCFGCDRLPKHAENAFHLWRNCPNKADKIVWENFQKSWKEFRERKQARQEQKRNQGRGAQLDPNAATTAHVL